MFGLNDEVKTILGGQVNSLDNVLTLRSDLHHMFDLFGIWFEEVPGKVRFTLCPILIEQSIDIKS